MKTCHLSKFLLLLYIIIIWSYFASQFELVVEFLFFESFINNVDIIHSSCHSAHLLVYLEIKINFAWNSPHNHTSVSIFYSLSFLISPFSLSLSPPKTRRCYMSFLIFILLTPWSSWSPWSSNKNYLLLSCIPRHLIPYFPSSFQWDPHGWFPLFFLTILSQKTIFCKLRDSKQWKRVVRVGKKKFLYWDNYVKHLYTSWHTVNIQ